MFKDAQLKPTRHNKKQVLRTKCGLTFVYCQRSIKSLTMAITFFTQSKKDLAPIYIRVREGHEKIDAKARTQFSVSPERLAKGKIKLHRTPNGANAKTKADCKERNKPLIQLQSELDDLSELVNRKLNERNDYEIINSNWLKRVVTPRNNETPTNLIGYFDIYLEDKKTTLRESTVKKIKSIVNRLKKFETDNGTIYLAEINHEFRSKLSKWHDKKGYAHNTKVKALKVVSTICNHAKKNGLKVHPDSERLAEDLKYKDTPHVYLNFNELAEIEKLTFIDERLEHAKDWLLISCNTAQRVSDFLKFSKKNIIQTEGVHFLDINQEKTGEPIPVQLNDTVTRILKKYNGNFPPQFSTNVGSNETLYNRLIKKVCREAKINELVKANLRQTETNRHEIKEVPKWQAVSSHIGRRSFATNYYGKINTALLISATGHASEKQFLTYVGKKPMDMALALAKELKRLSREQGKEQPLTVIKNASNG